MNSHHINYETTDISQILDNGNAQKLMSQYPYFSLPFILNAIASNQRIDYNVNATLLTALKEKVALYISDKSKNMNTTDMHIDSSAQIDYYSKIGVDISHDLPNAEELTYLKNDLNTDESSESKSPNNNFQNTEQALLVQRSFSDWLKYISEKKLREEAEEEDKKALRQEWQKQKLAAAIQEETDEIPEQVFKMAVDSIVQEDELISESMAEVYILQGKRDKAIEVYKKLILLNPEKRVYFADKIDDLQKEL